MPTYKYVPFLFLRGLSSPFSITIKASVFLWVFFFKFAGLQYSDTWVNGRLSAFTYSIQICSHCTVKGEQREHDGNFRPMFNKTERNYKIRSTNVLYQFCLLSECHQFPEGCRDSLSPSAGLKQGLQCIRPGFGKDSWAHLMSLLLLAR